MKKDIRIAAVGMTSLLGMVQSNWVTTKKLCIKAAALGAEIICFPELNLTGYTIDESLVETGLSIDGSTARAITDLSVELGVVILCGMAESTKHDKVYASHLVAFPDGHLEVYRKLHINPAESSVLVAGNHIPVFEYKGIRFGVMLCYDAHFPELATTIALLNADIIFVPHASPRGTSQKKIKSWLRHLPARAFDNGVFLVACNQEGENGAGLIFPRALLCLDPTGIQIESLPVEDGRVFLADLSAKKLQEVRSHRMRYFLPHRRVDLFAKQK